MVSGKLLPLSKEEVTQAQDLGTLLVRQGNTSEPETKVFLDPGGGVWIEEPEKIE